MKRTRPHPIKTYASTAQGLYNCDSVAQHPSTAPPDAYRSRITGQGNVQISNLTPNTQRPTPNTTRTRTSNGVGNRAEHERQAATAQGTPVDENQESSKPARRSSAWGSRNSWAQAWVGLDVQISLPASACLLVFTRKCNLLGICNVRARASTREFACDTISGLL